MREQSIIVEYPGAVASVNHYLGRRKGGGYYVKPEAKQFMETIGWLVKPFHLEDWQLPIHITCNGKFKDARSMPDLSNLSKCVMDSVQEATDINDVNFRWHDGSIILKKDETPELQIIFREASPS